jgi:hypothetical protein
MIQNLSRGALASVVKTTLTDIVQFQYNPESIKRSLKPRMSGFKAGQSPDEPSTDISYSDAAQQGISFTAYFDAADALQTGDVTATTDGIAPQLAVLEKLVNPSVAAVAASESSTSGGRMVVMQMEAPATLLVWGQNRVLPVRITSIDITEDAFDISLNPIRATVAISLDVQTYGSRGSDDLEYGRYKAYHTNIETLARSGSPSSTNVANLLQLLNR